MDFRRQALFIIVALTSVLGCRQDQAAKRELLERDLRLQEDRIYALENALDDAQRELDRARGITRDDCPPGSKPGLGSLFGGGNSSGSTFAAPSLNNDPHGSNTLPSPTNPGAASNNAPPTIHLPPKGDTAPPAVELPGGTGPAPPFRGAPIISPPDPKKPEGIPAPGGAAPPFKPGGAQFGNSAGDNFARSEPLLKEMSSPKFVSPGSSAGLGNVGIGSGGTYSNDVGDALPAPLPADLQVKSISLNRRTGGWNSDGKPGDDGIAVVLEPRNARGEVVPTPGAVTLVVIDPSIDNESGRFRWDFTSADSGAMFRPLATGGSGGLHFELPWPEGPPAHAKLKLFVRYQTDDGRKLQAEKDIFVDLGNGAASAWKNPTTQPVLTATRALGAPTANAATKVNATIPATGEANAVQPATLHWGAPKPPAATQGPDVLPSPSNAQPLQGTISGPSLGPALVAPSNAR